MPPCTGMMIYLGGFYTKRSEYSRGLGLGFRVWGRGAEEADPAKTKKSLQGYFGFRCLKELQALPAKSPMPLDEGTVR